MHKNSATRNTIFDEASINKLVAEKPNIAVQIYIVKAIDMAKAYYRRYGNNRA